MEDWDWLIESDHILYPAFGRRGLTNRNESIFHYKLRRTNEVVACHDLHLGSNKDGDHCPQTIEKISHLQGISDFTIVPYFEWAGEKYLLLGFDRTNVLTGFRGKGNFRQSIRKYNRLVGDLMSESLLGPTDVIINRGTAVILFQYRDFSPQANIVELFRLRGNTKDIQEIGVVQASLIFEAPAMDTFLLDDDLLDSLVFLLPPPDEDTVDDEGARGPVDRELIASGR